MRPGNAALKRLALLSLVLLGLNGCAISEAERLYNRGVHTRDLGRMVKFYTQAIELEPDFMSAYNNRGNAYNKRGLYDKAISDLNKAIELNSEFHLPYYNRGYTYQVTGQYDRAIQDYNDAIRLEPDFALAYNDRGLTYSKMGLHDRAIADGTKAINLFEIKGNKKGLAFVYGNRGYLYQEKGSYERAVSDLNKSIELDPNFDHAYSQLAWVRATSPVAEFRNGRRAVELAEKALILDRDAHNLDSLSAAYAEVGRFEEAIDVQMLAIALVKTKADKSSLAKFEKHLDRYKSHKPWRTNVPEALPEITKLNEQANQQYRAQGRHAEAEPLYKRALAVREKARRREAARKRELRQKIEALSGRYATARGKSQWNISFQDNRFEARLWGSGTLLYDGTVTGIEISGLAYYYSTTLCRRSKTTPLRGHVDLLRKSIEIIMEDFDILERINNKKCVPITKRREWTQEDRQ